MKIAWFTPYTRDSAIGRFSELVVAELARSAEISLWVPDLNGTRAAAVEIVPLQSCSPDAVERVSKCDLAVYNIGNYFPYHGLIYEFSRRVPGLVILHDVVLHHFCAALYLENRNDRDGYLRQLSAVYGDEARKAAEDAFAGRRRHIWETDDVSRWPLFEPVLDGALGVLTHSRYAASRIGDRFAGPVSWLHLPYDRGVPQRGRVGGSSEKILLVSVGQVVPTKRIHAVLNVLAACPDLRGRMEYAVIGQPDAAYKSECDRIIDAGGLYGAVRFLGRVDDATLHAYIAEADICVNLRFPVTEAASASLAEQMLHGKAVIVTDTGCYADLPADCVLKVNPADEHQSLRHAIATLAYNVDERRRLGNAAKAFADEHFSPAVYARGVERIIDDVCSSAPLLGYIDRVGGVLARMGVSPDMEICETVTDEIATLFGDTGGAREGE